MNKMQSNFVLRVMKGTSPVIITVPHSGLSSSANSWLEAIFTKRTRPDKPGADIIKGEKILLKADVGVLHIAADILKGCPVNLIAGLLPREYVDYNRFIPEVAYADKNLKPYYDEYHWEIATAIERLKKWHRTVYLFDFHGFSEQAPGSKSYDIILGTNSETCPAGTEKKLSDCFAGRYSVFCPSQDGRPESESEAFAGNTSNLYYHRKFGIESMLVEIAPRFRTKNYPDAKEAGRKLAADFGKFFASLV